MSRVGIITDSICGLSADLINKHDIRVAPMGINVNGKSYKDMVDIMPADIFKLFTDMKSPGTTNAATPGDFLRIYDYFSKSTKQMIYIGMSKTLSATFNIAQQTRKMYIDDHPGTEIEIVDTKNCIGAVGFIVLEAAKTSEAGGDLSDVIETVQNMIPRVKYFSLLDTLQFLIKIGRVPKSAASGETLNLRPIIGCTDLSGQIQNFPPAQAQKALEQMMALAEKYIEKSKPVHAMVHYAERLDEAEQLKILVQSRFAPVELYMTEYTPAAICSTGNITGMSLYT
jgi:DegV family protein with EDD domain